MNKVVVRVEKCEAYNLKPGDLFMWELPDPRYWERELERFELCLPLLIRTNVPLDDEVNDSEGSHECWRVVPTIVEEGKVVKTRMDPHVAPGSKDV